MGSISHGIKKKLLKNCLRLTVESIYNIMSVKFHEGPWWLSPKIIVFWMYFCIFSYIINADIAQIFVTSKSPGIISKIPWNSDQNSPGKPLRNMASKFKEYRISPNKRARARCETQWGGVYFNPKTTKHQFFKICWLPHFFTIFQSLFLMPGIIRIWHIICLHSVLLVQCRQL